MTKSKKIAIKQLVIWIIMFVLTITVYILSTKININKDENWIKRLINSFDDKVTYKEITSILFSISIIAIIFLILMIISWIYSIRQIINGFTDNEFLGKLSGFLSTFSGLIMITISAITKKDVVIISSAAVLFLVVLVSNLLLALKK